MSALIEVVLPVVVVLLVVVVVLLVVVTVVVILLPVVRLLGATPLRLVTAQFGTVWLDAVAKPSRAVLRGAEEYVVWRLTWHEVEVRLSLPFLSPVKNGGEVVSAVLGGVKDIRAAIERGELDSFAAQFYEQQARGV